MNQAVMRGQVFNLSIPPNIQGLLTGLSELQLREIKFRGVVTTALIYDSAPIIDYFRKVDENMVVAAADNKNKPDGTFFFYLTRSKK